MYSQLAVSKWSGYVCGIRADDQTLECFGELTAAAGVCYVEPARSWARHMGPAPDVELLRCLPSAAKATGHYLPARCALLPQATRRRLRMSSRLQHPPTSWSALQHPSQPCRNTSSHLLRWASGTFAGLKLAPSACCVGGELRSSWR